MCSGILLHCKEHYPLVKDDTCPADLFQLCSQAIDMPTEVLLSAPVLFDFTFLTMHYKTNLKSNGYEAKSPLIRCIANIYSISYNSEGALSFSDTHHYITIRKLLDCTFNIPLLFINCWEIQHT